MRARRPLLAVALSLWLQGCYHLAYQDAEGFERRGNYKAAAERVLDSLRQHRANPQAVALWQRVWPRHVEATLADVGAFEAKALWDEAVRTLSDLHALAIAAETQTLAAPLPAGLADRLASLRRTAADRYYGDGLAAEQAGRFRSAAIAYRTARRYVPDWHDAAARYQRTREAATVKVAFLPLKAHFGAYPEAVGLINDFLGLRYRQVDWEFVRVVDHAAIGCLAQSPLETAMAQARLHGMHYLLTGTVWADGDEQDDRTEERRAVKPASPGTRQAPLQATYRYHRRFRAATVNASVQLIRVADGTIAWQTREEERTTRTQEWVDHLDGPESALPDDDWKQLTNFPPYPVAAEELVEAAAELVRNGLARQLDTALAGLE